MTDIVVIPTSVVAVVGASDVARSGLAGETITAGKAVYKSSVTKKYMLADSNSATAEARRPIGIAANGASLNQAVAIVKSGDVVIGAALTPGLAYYLSDTPGGICPVADIGTGEYVCLIGLAKSATTLAVNIQFPNVAI